MKVGAHVTAFVQSVHAVPDICAYMIYCALGFDTEPDAIPPASDPKQPSQLGLRGDFATA